jgi:poly(hydroxyalkanoate) depolymerase family esterase
MFPFNAGAPRPTDGDARLTAAHDLVRHTLSQHGLMPGGDGAASPLAGWTLPKMPAFGMDTGSDASAHGMITDRFICDAGSRDFLLHVPDAAKDGATGLVVMLHGCNQNSADFATGTGMNALADQGGFIVLYPQQSRGDNTQSCWNWFSRGDQLCGKGEPAIIAGMAQKIATEHGIDAGSIFVAGLSAGGAMAVILGRTYPDIFAGIGAHSGLPYSAARDVPGAFAAMGGHATAPALPGPMPPTIVFHGTADGTVAAVNGERIAAQAVDHAAQTIEEDSRGNTGGRDWTLRTSSDDNGRARLEHWQIAELGHAWSGGQPNGSYTDPKGPDASAEMIRFFFDLAGNPEK